MSLVVPVALGERSYEIHIGSEILAKTGSLLRRLKGAAITGHVPVVTDATVAPLYYGRVAASLSAAGLSPLAIVLPPGEQTKSFAHLERLVDGLLTANVERGTVILALGGGVIGDL